MHINFHCNVCDNRYFFRKFARYSHIVNKKFSYNGNYSCSTGGDGSRHSGR